MRSYGAFLRRERELRGLRQKDLAYGICTVNTISRIENESQMPTAVLFSLLMERLGVSGFSYGDFFDGNSLALMKLRKKIVTHLDAGKLGKVAGWLGQMREGMNDGDGWDEQFLAFAAAWYFHHLDSDDEVFLKNLNDALTVTMEDYEPFGFYPVMESACYTQNELRIMNAIAAILYENNEEDESTKMFNLLIINQRKSYPLLAVYWRNMAVLCHNAAVAERRLFPKESEEHMKMALRAGNQAVDALLILRLARSALKYFPQIIDTALAKEMLRYLFLEFNNRYSIYGSFDEFMEEHSLLNII